jgi:hypothetical protein
MATSAQTSAHAAKGRASAAVGQYFYFFMSLLVAAVVIYGFSHTVNQNLIHAAPARPWLLWMHATLFSAWVAFFILQSALVRTRNVPLHRTLGWFGAALAAAMTVVGFATAVVMRRFDVRFIPESIAGPPAFILVPFWDITCFTVFFWLAVNWRRRPELHRRSMLIATCALTAAAWGRVPCPPAVGLWFYAAVDALILLGVVRDLFVMKKVHRIYWYALPLLVAGQVFVMRTMLSGAQWWTRIADWIVR